MDLPMKGRRWACGQALSKGCHLALNQWQNCKPIGAETGAKFTGLGSLRCRALSAEPVCSDHAHAHGWGGALVPQNRAVPQASYNGGDLGAMVVSSLVSHCVTQCVTHIPWERIGRLILVSGPSRQFTPAARCRVV